MRHAHSEAIELKYRDPWKEAARGFIVRAILTDAAANGGIVNPNRVRPKLRKGAGPSAPYAVDAQLVGPTYTLLVNSGVLVRHELVTSDDVAGGNAGKPIRTYKVNVEKARAFVAKHPLPPKESI